MVATITPSGVERMMGVHDIIVSKTDLKGMITYGNDVFCDIADYQISDVIEKPHNLVRNPMMPACVFKLLWDTIKSGKDIFAYVVNLGKKGDHYWVLAHITPSLDADGQVVGYHSNRRKPTEAALNIIRPLYAELRAEEAKYSTRREGAQAGLNLMNQILQTKGMTYEEFMFSF